MKNLFIAVLLTAFVSLCGCKHSQPTPTQPPVVKQDKKAVLVGINKYPGAPLNGCVNDANDIRSFIKVNYKFTDAEIVLLLDGDATTEKITNALNWLVADTKPDSIRLFWYSGHGAEYAGSDVSQQPDGKNQVICPVDFDWSEQHMIKDVQFNQLFRTMPNGVIFNWGSDSCHAGDLIKAIDKRYRRYPTIPPNVATQLAKVKKARGLVNGELEVGYISGCRFDQLSQDVANSQGRPCGAMTNAFFMTMNTGYMGKSLVEVVAKMNTLLTEQNPQAEGSRKDKPFLK